MIGGRSFNPDDFESMVEMILEAIDRGEVIAAYRLDRINKEPDDENIYRAQA